MEATSGDTHAECALRTFIVIACRCSKRRSVLLYLGRRQIELFICVASPGSSRASTWCADVRLATSEFCVFTFRACVHMHIALIT